MPRGRLTISDDEFTALYSVELLSTGDIAKRYGVVRQTVWHRAKRLGLTTYKRKSQRIKCENCGEEYHHWPSQGGKRYCSRRCYFAATSIFGKYSRQGQRQGRIVSGAEKGEVVHHINGDTFDNRPENLIVFNNNAQHAGFHKSGAAKWFLDSVNRGKIVMDGVLRWPK